MTLKLRHILLFASIGALFMLALSAFAADVYTETPTPLTGNVQYTFFGTSTTDTVLATTTSATSTNIAGWFDGNGRKITGAASIAGAEKATFYFGRTVHGTGNSRFELEVSPDGTNWYDFDRLIVEDGSNTATTTYTITSTSTDEVSMDLTYHAFNFVRCIVVETTDGTHTCSATIQF